jgi:hypothetical protein
MMRHGFPPAFRGGNRRRKGAGPVKRNRIGSIAEPLVTPTALVDAARARGYQKRGAGAPMLSLDEALMVGVDETGR